MNKRGANLWRRLTRVVLTGARPRKAWRLMYKLRKYPWFTERMAAVHGVCKMAEAIKEFV